MYGIYVSGSVIAKFVTPMTVRSNHPVFASDTLSLSRQISRRAAQRWEIETQLEPLSQTANELFVDIVTKGYSEAVTIITPQNYGVISKRTRTDPATATGTLGAGSVTISGGSGLIPKGTFVKFANHTKVYMTTTERDGPGTVSIYPNLISGVSAQTMTCGDDVIMTCLYDLDTISGMVYTDGILMDMGTVKLVEYI
jgi:hypothetical protein